VFAGVQFFDLAVAKSATGQSIGFPSNGHRSFHVDPHPARNSANAQLPPLANARRLPFRLVVAQLFFLIPRFDRQCSRLKI